MKATLAAAALIALANPALADLAAGERAFTQQCATCHVVQNEAGEVLAGRNARQGPNLYAVEGRIAGSVDGFRYGAGIVQAGEMGLAWDEETFVAYVQNPNDFLRSYTGNRQARGNMAFRVRAEADARNLWAYITSLTPVAEETEEEKPSTEG
mgnify:FL=1